MERETGPRIPRTAGGRASQDATKVLARHSPCSNHGLLSDGCLFFRFTSSENKTNASVQTAEATYVSANLEEQLRHAMDTNQHLEGIVDNLRRELVEYPKRIEAAWKKVKLSPHNILLH